MARKESSRIHALLSASALLLVGGGAAMIFFRHGPDRTISVDAQPIFAERLALGAQVYKVKRAACYGVNGRGQPTGEIPDDDGVHPAPAHDSNSHTWQRANDFLLFRRHPHVIFEPASRETEEQLTPVPWPETNVPDPQVVGVSSLQICSDNQPRGLLRDSCQVKQQFVKALFGQVR